MTKLDRRHFLAVSAAATSGVLSAAEKRPPVVNPRATSGDDRHEPDWKSRLTISVGPGKADLTGTSERVVQAAVDYVSRLGGGTVKILPGVYRFRNAVYLQSGVRIVGSGADSVLMKEPSVTTELTADSDWYDQEITLKDPRGFRLGDGICLRTKNPHNGGSVVLKRTLVARSGNRFKLDRALRENLWLSGKPTCASLFALFSGERIRNLRIENLTFDGNRKNNEMLDGNHAGCIWLQDCNQISMRDLITRNYNGDGISWQICHDVTVDDCHSHDNANLGLHPGSGSQRPVIRNNRLERNGIGIFWCWGVKFGYAEGNKIRDSRDYGISIGHNDTDNVMRNNDVIGSGKVGILFRDDSRGKDFWANRNRIEQNRIVDSGAGQGVAIDVRGQTKDLVIKQNEIRETRKPMKRIGIRVSAKAKNIELAANKIEGFAQAIKDMRG